MRGEREGESESTCTYKCGGMQKEHYCTIEVKNQASTLTPQYIFTHNLILYMFMHWPLTESSIEGTVKCKTQ